MTNDPIINYHFDKLVQGLESEIHMQTTINILVAIRSALNYNRHDFIVSALSNS